MWCSSRRRCDRQYGAARDIQVLRGSPGHDDSDYITSVRRSFLYAVYRQQYLEHIDRREYQQVIRCPPRSFQAFNDLTKRLKPLESSGPPDEMRELSYLVTCRSVQVCCLCCVPRLVICRTHRTL